jgi:hypothetical protein
MKHIADITTCKLFGIEVPGEPVVLVEMRNIGDEPGGSHSSRDGHRPAPGASPRFRRATRAASKTTPCACSVLLIHRHERDRKVPLVTFPPAANVLFAPGDEGRAGEGHPGTGWPRGLVDDAALHAPESGGNGTRDQVARRAPVRPRTTREVWRYFGHGRNALRRLREIGREKTVGLPPVARATL